MGFEKARRVSKLFVKRDQGGRIIMFLEKVREDLLLVGLLT